MKNKIAIGNNQKIQVVIKRFEQELPLPQYQSGGAAAFDLYSREEVEIPSGEVGYASLNIALQLPENYWALISARSSLHKRGLMLVNGIGVGDSDYRGDGDEYRAALLNFSKSPVKVKRGERIVQMIILSRQQIEFIERTTFDTKDRGGFGTTGK